MTEEEKRQWEKALEIIPMFNGWTVSEAQAALSLANRLVAQTARVDTASDAAISITEEFLRNSA